MRLQTLMVACMFLFGATYLHAQTQYIGPNGGDWFDVSNWNNGLPANGNDPLIGGGISVTIGSPLTIDFSITNFGGIVAEAVITNNGTISNSGTFDVTSTGGLVNNGTFNNFNSSTFAGAASFTNESGASFTNGGNFILNSTLVNRGNVTNNGSISAASGTLITEGNFDNAQTLTTESLTVLNGSTFTNNFGANLNISGATAELQIDGNFNNLGTVTADGFFTVNGTFSNNTTVTINGILTINNGGTFNSTSGLVSTLSGVQNFGTFINGFQLVNSGSFNNFGLFNNNNLIDNQSGGTFTNRSSGTISMGFGSKVVNAGTFINENAFNSFGTIENNGGFTNTGIINSFGGSQIINNSGFTNEGTVSTNDKVLLDGPFENLGTVNINGGSLWTNSSSFLNSTTGSVNVQQDFVNTAAGTVTNNGRWTNLVRTRNDGSFTNNALFEILSENLTNSSGATFTNNELILLSSGNLRNDGGIINNAEVYSDECSTLNNSGNINNPGHFEIQGILFQTGTVSGNPIDCQGCYVHTSATSDAPNVCQNGTFGADINGDVKVYAPELIAFSNFDSCANIVYLADGIDRPVYSCSDIGNVITVDVVLRTRLNDSLTCTAEITPVDVLEPQFDSCPKDIVIFTPNSTETATWTEPTAVDNCTTTTLTSNFSPGDSFPIGITGVTYTASDDYGNENNCQFRVDVRQTGAGVNCDGDAQAPTFVDCPDDIVVSTGRTTAVVGWTPPTPVDNCYPLTMGSDYAPGQSFGVGETTVVYSAFDGNGNEGTCEFTVIVNFDDPCLVDNVPPAFTNCPANIYRPTNPLTGGAVAIWTDPGIFDLCGLASVSATHNSGDFFQEGTNIVTYTAEDNSGNVSSCNFVVTVGANPCPGDVSLPVFSNCPTDISVVTTGNSGVASWSVPTASSTCTPLIINNNYSPGTTFQLGITTVVYSASDLLGNVGTCSFNVNVQNDCAADSEPPVLTGCPADLTVASIGGFGAANWVAPTATDNCQLTTFQSSFQPGASFPEGVTTVIYTAADLQGNIATCEFNIFVVAAPACTQNASPIEGTTNVDPSSVTLSWDTEILAITYDVYLGTSNPPTNLVASGVSGTSTTVTGLQAGANYFWYVVPNNPAGSGIGCESTVTSFSTSGNGGGSGGDCNFEAIFVVGNTSLNSSDAFVKNRLEQLGFNVTLINDNYSQTSDADGKGLIVISSTVNSGYVNSKYRHVTVPVICWEPWLYDDFRMTGTGSGSNYGSQYGVSYIKIENAGHPLAAGLSGTVPVFGGSQQISWGKPSSGAVVVGSNPSSTDRKLLFAYDTGDQMVGTLSAPAPRVGFFLQNSNAHYMNANGLALFDASVRWATGTAAAGSICDDGNPNTENDVILDDFCTCEGTVVCDGQVNGFFFTDTNDNQILALENGGSYPVNLLPASYNIEAVTSGTHESAYLELSGPVSYAKVENYVPWHLFGTGGSNTLTPGSYTLTVSLFSEDGANGAVCSQTTINFTIEDNDPCLTNGPEATAASASANCGQNNGSITFSFPDHPGRSNIEFSIDGGNTYPFNTPDDAGDLTVSNLASGTYDIWVRWGNNDCPTNMGTITVDNSVNAPNAVCQDLTLQLTSIGQPVQISGADVDGGSSAGCGNITSLNASPNSFAQPGTYTVTLTVTNSFGLSSTCHATVTVNGPTGPCPVNVIFHNEAPCKVDVYWFNGTNEIFYNTLSNGQSYTQGTYDTHIWRVRNATNGTLILEYVTAGCNQQTVTIDNCGTEICKGPAGTGLTREVWTGISGVTLNDLTSSANYPNDPTYSDVNAGSTGPVGIGDNYGTRVRGFITPSASGIYTFYVTGDDHTDLYLSTDANPANATLIANINGWTGQTEYYKYGSQKSVSISLTAGHDYYVELLHKEGGGGDHWGIHWTTGSGNPYPISLDQLSPISDCNGGGGCNSEVLFVVGNTSLNSGDAWVNSRLATLGYTVELVDDDYVQTENSNGKGLVIISSTVSSGKVGNKFTYVPVPVLTWEAYLFDNLKMTGTSSGYDYGSYGSQTNLTIDDPSHPLAAGLSGNVQVYTYSNSMNWAWVPYDDLVSKVARVGNTNKLGILAYDTDELLYNNTYPAARRVSLWLNNTSATLLNSNGVALFDAAIDWASGCAGTGLGGRAAKLDFVAHENDFDVELMWVSNSPELDENFLIERSADGEYWELVDEIQSEQKEVYKLLDHQPMAGKSFYRVTSFLTDGTVLISNVEEVFFAELENYAVFPNPAREQVFVNLSHLAGAEVLIRLFDAKGVQVQQWEVIATEEPMPIKLRQKQSGQYLLWMYVNDRQPMTQRLFLERN